MPADALEPDARGEGGERPGGNSIATWLTLIGLGLGVAFEILFYGHPFGVSFPIWVMLAIVALLGTAMMESVPLKPGNLWLVGPIAFLAVMTCLRVEPLTVFLDVVLTLAMLALWVRTFRAGRLADHGWVDLGLAVTWAPIEALLRPWETLGVVQRRLIDEKGGRRGLFAVVRGALLAIPVLAVFLVLLSAADLVFGEYVEIAFRWFDLARLADWAGRGLVILLASVFSLGAIVAALRDAAGRRLIADRGPLVRPFLGFTEVSIVLASVDVLFALFVLVQIAYLFGGEANVTAAGFTYSEYARRGFGELVAVGFLSLGLITTVAAVTQRETNRRTTLFNVLSGSLVVLVGVILASALKRLLLYEQAYGFTRLRTYTHVAILWMAAVFVGFLILLLRDRLRRFAPVCAAMAVGFAATLSLLNVDAFIVNRNLTRLAATGELDVEYLAGLSEDALPGLVSLAIAGPAEERDLLLPELACWNRQLQARQDRLGWPSTNFSRLAGETALTGIAPLLSGITVEEKAGIWWVGTGSSRRLCLHQARLIRAD